MKYFKKNERKNDYMIDIEYINYEYDCDITKLVDFYISVAENIYCF